MQTLRIVKIDPIQHLVFRCSRCSKCLAMYPSRGGLHLLIDSTGIKMIGEGEWKRKKYGAEYRSQWRKLHIGIDAETLQIRAALVTDSRIGDASILPHLLNKIPQEEQIIAVGADGAYDTK